MGAAGSRQPEQLAAEAKERTKQAGAEAGEKARKAVEPVAKHPAGTKLLGAVVLIAALLAVLAVGGVLAAAAVTTFLLAVPLLLLFSPVLFPLAVLVLMVLGGFLSTEAFMVLVTSFASWFYNYIKGRHPPGADQVEAAKSHLLDTATHVKDMAIHYGSNVSGLVDTTVARHVAP